MLGNKKYFRIILVLFIIAMAIGGIAYAFTPPSQPAGVGGGTLFTTSTGALGIATTTFYSDRPQWIFKTQGGTNQHIIFLPNGNVGIGLTNPAEKLEVNGNIKANSFIGTSAGAVSAANVSSESFGRLQGGGNYSFPSSLAVGTTTLGGTMLPTNGLFVLGDINIGTTTVGTIDFGNSRFIHNYGTNNAFIGKNAGNGIVSGSDNAGVGSTALYSNSSGNYNTGVGSAVLYENTGSHNTAVGYSALRNKTSGDYNIALGSNALLQKTSGGFNVAVGYYTLGSNTTGAQNTALGHMAGWSNVGSNNVFLGFQAGYNEFGSNKLYIANTAGVPLIYGDFSLGRVGINNSIASYTLDVLGDINVSSAYRRGGTIGISITCPSGQALATTTVLGGIVTGGACASLSSGAVTGNGTINYFPFWTGASTLSSTSSIYQTAVGNVGLGMTAPSEQLEIAGNFELPQTISTAGIIKMNGSSFIHGYGTNNTFAGKNAGNFTMTGSGNAGFGEIALFANTSGANNVALGYAALRSNTTGGTNIAIGMSALNLNTSGSNNAAIGVSALASNNGSNNIAIGLNASRSNTSGQGNTVVGTSAGYSNVSGSGNVFLGSSAGYLETGSSKLYIANGPSQSETLIYGDFVTGNVGIGAIAASYKLDVLGDINIPIDVNKSYRIGGRRALKASLNDYLLLNPDLTFTNGIFIPGGSLVMGTSTASPNGGIFIGSISGASGRIALFSDAATAPGGERKAQIEGITGNAWFSGNVAIGGTPPGVYKLDVTGDTNTTGVYRRNGTAGLNSTTCPPGYALANITVLGGIVTGGTCTSISAGGGVTGSGTTNYFPFWQSATVLSTNSSIYQDGGGDIGIGTAAPGAGLRLDVSGGGFGIGGTQVVDTSRNLTNIVTISSVALKTGSGGSAVNTPTGANAVTTGSGTSASGHYSFAGGLNSSAVGIASIALGSNANTGNSYALAVGQFVDATGVGSVTIGQNLTASGGNSVAIGAGVSSATRLVNGTSNSIMFATNSNLPTLYIGPSGGTGTTGNVGVATVSPQAKLEVSGGGVRLNPAGITKPSCTVTIRGTFWVTYAASGVKDNVEVCAKDAANVYAWRTIY